MQGPESRQTSPRNTAHWSTTGKWHKSPMQPYTNIWNYFQWLFTVVYLHDLITYYCTKCMEMLSGLFPIQTNSLISFHKQSSVLLHQGTTFKELLSLVFDRQDLCAKISHADIPPSTDICWSRPVLCKVIVTCWGMQLRMQMYPPVEPSGGQDQYYIRTPWHVEECNWECRCSPCCVFCCYCYCWMLLFLLFNCDCG